jgi:hypothetical protein
MGSAIMHDNAGLKVVNGITARGRCIDLFGHSHAASVRRQPLASRPATRSPVINGPVSLINAMASGRNQCLSSESFHDRSWGMELRRRYQSEVRIRGSDRQHHVGLLDDFIKLKWTAKCRSDD